MYQSNGIYIVKTGYVGLERQLQHLHDITAIKDQLGHESTQNPDLDPHNTFRSLLAMQQIFNISKWVMEHMAIKKICIFVITNSNISVETVCQCETGHSQD